MTSNPDTVLLTRLRSQLEFYFSPQNLARDVYLRNLLNSYGFNAVPLSIIANFPKVRSLCNGQIDFALLKRSVEGSGIVSVTNDAVWISPLLPLPPLDTKPQQRATLGATQPPQPQVQQPGVSTKAAEAGDGSRTHSANSSQNSLIAMSNGYVNENGAYTPNTTNAAPPVPARASDSSRPNQSQHPGHNSLSDTSQAQLPSQPAPLNTAAPSPPHQQPHPAHANAIPYPAAPIAHPSHGATTYAYPQYAYRYPPGPAYHHHPPGGYSAYPSHMVPYHIYGYPPYVQNDGARGYFTGGRGGGGPMGARANGEGENGGMRRSSTGKGSADGSKKGKGKAKKTSGMQHYQNHHGADSGGNANNYYGGPAQQQQPQRWKGERSDGGNSSGNDTYGKPTGKNHHHQSRGAGKYDNTSWDRMNRGNNRSQNDIIPQTDAEGRIGSGDAYYGESNNNPLVRGGGGPLNAKPSGNRKKKNKRREGDSERRKDSNLAQTSDNPKREIFDANSFPALPPTKIEIAGGNSGANQTKSLPGNDSGSTKTVDTSSVSIHPISGYADALKQTTKSFKSLMTEQQSSVSAQSGGPSHNDNVGPQNATTSATVVTPPPSEMTTTTNATKIAEDTFADMKITPSSTDGTPQTQEPQTVFESETTIAVGVLTGIPMTTTEVEPKSTAMSLESTISLSPQSSVSPTDTASNAQQSNKHEPTPREATHSIPKPPEEDMTPVLTDGSAGIAQAEERGVLSSVSSSSPPSAWGSKRSWIDVARKQS